LRNRWFTTEPKTPEYFGGLRIQADEGVHSEAFELVRKWVPPGSAILDVGAGTGAFSIRLAQAGYAVTGLDVDPTRWSARGLPFIQLDLDRGVAASVTGTYHAICCLEVIEHVENPWQLMRELRSLLKPNGFLVMSTPNVTSFYSRALFLRAGVLHSFDAAGLEYGHINPITEFEMRLIASRTGYESVDALGAGYLPVLDLTSWHPKALALNVLRLLAFLVGRGRTDGWCVLFAFRSTSR
jgi:SAM-dependent methyltransferase